jgi:raffinose/stachyose/melibiose transport system permease protein
MLNGRFGIGPVQWLSDDRLAQFSVIMVGVWAQVGWHAVLYLGYLQSIPNDYQDAALVDGASAVRRFFNITVPLLAPAMTVSIVLLMVGGLRVYELPLALTNGGPVYSTYTVTQNILSYGVSNGEFGEGTALSVVFLFLVIVVLLGSLAVLRHREGRLR